MVGMYSDVYMLLHLIMCTMTTQQRIYDIGLGALAVAYPPLAIILQTGISDRQRLVQNLVMWGSINSFSQTIASTFVMYLVYTSNTSVTDIINDIEKVRQSLSPEAQASINNGITSMINIARSIQSTL